MDSTKLSAGSDVVRTTYTVTMLIGTKPVGITSPNGELIARIAERWRRANPQRQVTVFVNDYVA